MRCAALALAILLQAVCLLSCADSGSRGPQPNVWAGAVGGYWWAGATAAEQQQLTETLNLHAKMLGRHLGAIPRADVHFYESKQALSAKVSQIQTTQRPNTYNLTRIRSVFVNNGQGEAFLHLGAVHIYAGGRLEGPELGHAILHAVLADALVHHVAPNVNGTAFHFRGAHGEGDPALTALWVAVLTDDFLLSLQLKAQR